MKKLIISIITFVVVIITAGFNVLADELDVRITSGLTYLHTLTAEEQNTLLTLFQETHEQEQQAETDLSTILANLVSGVQAEITFDNIRSVTGRAKAGTNIRVIGSLINEDENSIVMERNIVVGGSGVFNIDIELLEGDNITAIVFELDSEIKLVVVSSIRRMPEVVRLELSTGLDRRQGLNNLLFGEN